MQIASMGNTPQMAQMAKASEANEGAGRDGDADDNAVKGPTPSATAPGVGNSVDVSA